MHKKNAITCVRALSAEKQVPGKYQKRALALNQDHQSNPHTFGEVLSTVEGGEEEHALEGTLPLPGEDAEVPVAVTGERRGTSSPASVKKKSKRSEEIYTSTLTCFSSGVVSREQFFAGWCSLPRSCCTELPRRLR